MKNLPLENSKRNVTWSDYLSRQHLIKSIELLKLPNELSGIQQWKSAKVSLNSFAIKNDLHAISVWLEQYAKQEGMLRSCKSAIEKLLLWCIVERGHSLSQLSVEEVNFFVKFLNNITPIATWVRESNPQRSSSEWRPYSKYFLSPASISLILVLLKLYFRFIVENGRLDLIAIELEFIRLTTSERSRFNCNNKFDPSPKILLKQWVLLRQQIPDSNATKLSQLTIIVTLEMMYFAGLTLEHIHQLTWDDLQPIYLNGAIVTWKISLKEKINGHVYSISTLTKNLCQLLYLQRDTKPGSKYPLINSRIICRSKAQFYWDMIKVKKRSMEMAESLGFVDDFKFFKKFNSSQIRGGAMYFVQLLNPSQNLIEVYGQLLLIKYPSLQKYFPQENSFTVDEIILEVENLSDWFETQINSEMQSMLNCEKSAPET